MNLLISINTDGAAFDDGLEGTAEVSRILRELSTKIYNAEELEDSNIKDINGNNVGRVEVREE